MKKMFLLLALLPMAVHLCAQSDTALSVGLGNGLSLELVRVEGGEFVMGCNSAAKGVSRHYESSAPEHRVSVGSFFLCKYEITQQVWQAVMGSNPSLMQGDSLPVHQISWEEARQFAALVSQMTGRRFRLPTEAEWEYAARGGNRSKGQAYAGCDRMQLGDYAWYCLNSGNALHAVGGRKPNVLGLYDMSGNISEWCADWMEPYTEAPRQDPRGSQSGESRVVRGGHYESTSPTCTVYDRSWYVPTAGTRFIGLRLVMEIDPQQEGAMQ